MGCDIKKDPDGQVTAIICNRGTKRSYCQDCHRPCDKLCDFPLTGEKEGQTCDRKMCPRHSVHVEGKDLDYCLTHARMKGLIQ